ncbi:MAG: hypothetical protein E7218_05215 [Anaerofustis stercorihominis]|nr:hypothetical protein [Anaerofustis stercorihominis]
MRKRNRYILCIAVIVCVFLINYFVSIPQEEVTAEKYKGIIQFYDIATPTVLGNDFSVISTICEEFSEGLEFSFVKLNKINSITPTDTYLSVQQNADIIRYDPSLTDMNAVMTDTDFTLSMKKVYPEVPVKSDTGKVIVPYWYDIYVIILNRDLLEKEEIDFRGDITRDSLCAVISSAYEKGGEEYLGYSSEKAKELLFDTRYPTAVANEYDLFGDESRSISEFAEGDIVLYLGTLKDVAYLQRQIKRGKNICSYDVQLYPADEEVMYISEIGSYAFRECEDVKKKELLLDIAEYVHSYDAMKYTENLGMLAWIPYEEIQYEKYPYLREFAYFIGRRIFVE